MKNNILLKLYIGLDVHTFETSEENIKNLYKLYYGWSVDAPWRKLNKNPINITGGVVINGLRRNYKESRHFNQVVESLKCIGITNKKYIRSKLNYGH